MYIFLDTETTGLDKEDRLIQLAYAGLDSVPTPVNGLFCPPIPIKISSMAIHHKTPEMIFGKCAFCDSKEKIVLNNLLEDTDNILVAHNASFDIEMLAKEGVVCNKFICTQKIITYLDINGILESYSMQYLRYWFRLKVVCEAHDAMGDVLVLIELFKNVIAPKLSIEKMLDISSKPTLIPKINFGKYKGLLFKDIPKDYLDWISNQSNISKDIIFTANYWINEN